VFDYPTDEEVAGINFSRLSSYMASQSEAALSDEEKKAKRKALHMLREELIREETSGSSGAESGQLKVW
jgi:hypothetical protein